MISKMNCLAIHADLGLPAVAEGCHSFIATRVESALGTVGDVLLRRREAEIIARVIKSVSIAVIALTVKRCIKEDAMHQDHAILAIDFLGASGIASARTVPAIGSEF